jgi:hypothetical protein
LNLIPTKPTALSKMGSQTVYFFSSGFCGGCLPATAMPTDGRWRAPGDSSLPVMMNCEEKKGPRSPGSLPLQLAEMRRPLHRRTNSPPPPLLRAEREFWGDVQCSRRLIESPRGLGQLVGRCSRRRGLPFAWSVARADADMGVARGGILYSCMLPSTCTPPAFQGILASSSSPTTLHYLVWTCKGF